MMFTAKSPLVKKKNLDNDCLQVLLN